MQLYVADAAAGGAAFSSSISAPGWTRTLGLRGSVARVLR